MRDYGETEIIREKCHWCGSKNKLYTDLLSGRLIIGGAIRCCNCGEVQIHINPENDVYMQLYLSRKYVRGQSRCIQESPCVHTKCSFYRQPLIKPDGDNPQIIPSENDVPVDTITEIDHPKKFR